ncbi:unnamed protein product [Bathycoccus prasinos]
MVSKADIPCSRVELKKAGTERAIIMERMNKIATDEGFIIAVDSLYDVWQNPRELAERALKVLQYYPRGFAPRGTNPAEISASSLVRLLLAKGYQNDVAYAPFLQQYLEDPSKTLEELARQIKAKCDEIPYMFDKVVPGQVAAIFAATTEAANKPGHAGGRGGRKGLWRSRKWRRNTGRGEKRYCCASSDHFIRDCPEHKKKVEDQKALERQQQ